MADIAQYFTTNDELIFERNQIDWRGAYLLSTLMSN